MAVTPILAPQDEITGTDRVATKFGTSTSADNPALTTSADSFDINLDADGTQTVSLASNTDSRAIAQDIQTKVRALTAASVAQSVYDDFTAVYDSLANIYVLTSGSLGATASSCLITAGAGTAAANLKLGTANGGKESTTAAPVIAYTVHYRLVEGAGTRFTSVGVEIDETDMTDPTDLNELQTLTDAIAAQVKADRFDIPATTESGELDDLDGNVTL